MTFGSDDLSRHVVLALLALALFGQDYRAKIQGIVTDASDASMAGARVTIRNVNTGITATRETGANGAYIFDNVEPGTYVAYAEFQGFSRQQQEGVLVQTRADVTVNFNLKPGALVETVTVSSQAVSLQFNSTTRELTVDTKMLADLPQEQRLRGEETGMVADEPERLEERVRVRGVEDQRTHRTNVRRAVTSTRSSESASATTSTPAE